MRNFFIFLLLPFILTPSFSQARVEKSNQSKPNNEAEVFRKMGIELSNPSQPATSTIAGAGVLNLTSSGSANLMGIRYNYYGDTDCSSALVNIDNYATSDGADGSVQITGPRTLTFIPSAVANIVKAEGYNDIATEVKGITFEPLAPGINTFLFNFGGGVSFSHCFVLNCTNSPASCTTSTDQDEATYAG